MSTEEETEEIQEEGKPNLSFEQIGTLMGLRQKNSAPTEEAAEGAKAAGAEAAKQVKKTDKSTQDKLVEGQMLEKMQEGMTGIASGAPAGAIYQLEPEQEFRNRTQGYVRALMNLGGKQG